MFVQGAKSHSFLMLAALVLVVATLACGESSPPAPPVSAGTDAPPTAAPTPSSLTFNEIERQHEDLTDMQWEASECVNHFGTTLPRY